ncbi:TPA: LPXTG cell wall anchor domain-containing protein [Enterococcus faecalis]|uniref:LPXTG cell wall anchor domain-containing protein n=1 Tax=Bacteria TaxID=2 RepID=UPI000453B51E|nr:MULTISPECIES: LPXTG cell wall anchor domain-containing protein [Enterococcus]EKC6778423.1 LPXTG cell wall anchor domain-containing protein [Enterococcus faecalis]EZP90405.1 peptidase [Enterococcus faecium VRE1044]EZP93378.1 peptidase [Enterococcus faecium VSE1036]EZP96448.1 peptidase [Enterococcus faecium VRE1261]KWX92028.1 peptidase [Enterococcus faecium]
MKKTTLAVVTTLGISLFSFQLGSSLVYADETVETPKSEIVETLPGEGLPDVETELNGGTTEKPAEPEQLQSEKPEKEPVAPEPEFPESTLPTDSIEEEGVHSSTTTDSSIVTTPEQSGTTSSSEKNTDSSSMEQPTMSSTSEEPKEEPKQPAEKSEAIPAIPKENKPVVPAKEVTVSVIPNGEITTNTSQGMSVPIVTSNVEELTHIPTPTTPLKAEGGQTIVGVKDGIPLIQDSEGNLVKDLSIPVKKLPSGNIEVKTADGKTKVLPKTGEEIHVVLSVLGGVLTSIAGFVGYKRKRKGIENEGN